jgi:hypothetical protein
MTLPILGAAEGFTEEEASKPAIALGIGLQLTNILRDVGEDLERGKCGMQACTTVLPPFYFCDFQKLYYI